MATVLVVDDIAENVELLEAYLIPEAYDVVAASNGIEALEQVAQNAPDIVLLDVMMPQMDGFEVCRRLKTGADTQFIPVVMVTALKDRDDRIRGIEAGADDFLSKPVDRMELLTRIRSLVRVKGMHDDLEQSYRELKELERTKDRLTQMIIHDLKNPLTGVKANLEIVGMENLGDTQECLNAAQRSCDILFNMIQDLLDISRMEEGMLTLQREPVQIKEVVNSAAGEVEVPAAAEGKEIRIHILDGLPDVSGDRNLIYRTLSNLLINAVKHTGRGGQITVRAVRAGEMLEVQVSDTGYGIPEDYLESIFEKFGQVEGRQRSGSGLGLTFCKMAVEAHRGRIWVESEEGVGSTFAFELPV